jgi:tripartite-type tricarboxylate transporter receptor subunit TctC
MKRKLVLAIAIVCLMALGMSAYAADYPTKPIMLQVAYPPGGSTDVGARILASIAEKEMGPPIVVINKAGAGGQIGWSELARQKPDGYYLGLINLPHLPSVVVDPERKATFKAEDIVPLISQSVDPTLVSVRPDSPWKTLKDLIEEAKKKPGQITAGIVGILQDDEIGYLQLAEAAGIELRRVYFDGAAPAITALLGKHVDVLFCTVGDNYTQWKAGNIQLLAIMDKERSKFYPDMPTTAECGYPSVISASTRGLAAPKGLPAPIAKKIMDVFKKAMFSKEHIDKLEGAAQPVKIIFGEEFVKYYYESFNVSKKYVDILRKK